MQSVAGAIGLHVSSARMKNNPISLEKLFDPKRYSLLRWVGELSKFGRYRTSQKQRGRNVAAQQRL